MVRRQQNILISSKNRTSASLSTSDFTVRLDRPIQDVVRTDLRELILTMTSPPTNRDGGTVDLPFLAIQSAQLGNNILSSAGISMYDIVPVVNQSWPLVYQRYSNRVDSTVYSQPSLLYQIDIRFVDQYGQDFDFRGADVYVLLEVITDS